jgi:hypothetical protein
MRIHKQKYTICKIKQIYEGGNRDKEQLYGVPDKLSDRGIGGSIPVRGKICIFCTASLPALEPTHPLIP